MELTDYRAYLRRAEDARTVTELRRIADDAKAAYPDDPDAELIDQTCFTYAAALIERQAERNAARASASTFAIDLTDQFPRLRLV
jgi:hypothetical protein